jgi:hypothetical protein
MQARRQRGDTASNGAHTTSAREHVQTRPPPPPPRARRAAVTCDQHTIAHSGEAHQHVAWRERTLSREETSTYGTNALNGSARGQERLHRRNGQSHVQSEMSQGLNGQPQDNDRKRHVQNLKLQDDDEKSNENTGKLQDNAEKSSGKSLEQGEEGDEEDVERMISMLSGVNEVGLN